jgi:hypothetical protein
LTTPSDNTVVEHWRGLARAAALAEHDTATEVASHLTAPQAQALVGDLLPSLRHSSSSTSDTRTRRAGSSSTFGLWFSQCVPIAMWISLAHTAERLSTAQHRRGTAPTVSAGLTILSSLWFGPQTRYLQRRVNQLWAHMAQQQLLAPASVAPPASVSAPVSTPAPVTGEPTAAPEVEA